MVKEDIFKKIRLQQRITEEIEMGSLNMRSRMIRRVIIACLLIIALFTLNAGVSLAEDTEVKIGILAKRGIARCIEKWSPMAEYLTTKIPGKTFVVVPVDSEGIFSFVEFEKIDFVLANPSIYVELENWYGANRIATLKNKRIGRVVTRFGGLIFCKADRKDIQTLNDLKGKTFMAANEASFGGWRIAFREFKGKGIDPYKDFKDMRFGGTHDTVVYAVKDGKVDAGTVRTDTLERMAINWKIDINTFRIINDQPGKYEDFPFILSTRLYPEWPFAKLKHTSDELAEKVAIALLGMPANSPAAFAARCAGWTSPLNYQSVHECLKELRLGPYKDFGKITPSDVVKKYWAFILAIAILFAAVIGAAIFILRLNRNIKIAHVELQSEVEERKKREKDLRESEERFKDISYSIADWIWEVDNMGRYTFTSGKVKEILGYNPEELIGKTPFELMPEDEAKRIGEVFKRISCEKKPIVDLENLNLTKEGREVWLLTNSVPILDESGELIGYRGVDKNITKRKQEERELTEANTQLEQAIERANLMALEAEAANMAKSEFLANMSHEIRTPMNGILGFADLLLEEELTQEHRDVVQTIKKSGETLLNLINNILDISKVESSKIELETIPFNIENLILDIGELMRTNLGEKPVEINCHIGDIHTNLLGDPTRLRQIITNLTGNAIKFTEEGEIAIEVQNAKLKIQNEKGGEDDEVELLFSVRDTGIGIPVDKLDTIFESFKQVDGSTTRKYGGSGLGLTISKELAQLMGGDIWVESPTDFGLRPLARTGLRPGGIAASGPDGPMPRRDYGLEDGKSHIQNQNSKFQNPGSVFYFTAQFKKDLESSEAVYPVDESQLEGKPILIVDDNETALQIISDIVKRAGMTPVLTRSGEEALEYFRFPIDNCRFESPQEQSGDVSRDELSIVNCQLSIDIALIDIMLPGMSGYDLAEKISNLTHEKTKLIALSSNTVLGAAAESQRSGFAGFIPKPVRRKVLIDLIRTVMGIGEKKPKSIVTRHSVKEAISHDVRILYAEDNLVNQKLGIKMLERMGYKTEIASDGVEAVKMVKDKGPYDIIFMDIQMPNMNGLEATSRIRELELKGKEESGHVPIVALTANAMKGDREKCIEAGMDDYLSKPFKREDIQRVIRELVHKGEVQAEVPGEMRILVVEDEEKMRNSIIRLLKRKMQAAKVMTAEDGIDATAKLGSFMPDLILLDIRMPRMDGVEFIRYIQETERYAKTGIVVITGLHKDDSRVAAVKDAGVEHILYKPCDDHDLISVIKESLSS